MTALRDRLTIGELSARSGLAPSALRYYEELGLIHSERTAGGQRRYARAALRRVAFVRAAQQVGLSLEEARRAMGGLPQDRSPNAREWARVASTWQHRIDARIAELERLRRKLDGCIGCGCLSLRTCRLYNPDDAAADGGPGARYLLGDEPPEPAESAEPAEPAGG
ncbi:redox-sensitive transcriptional activator SoxR [Streptacidiphilus sp. ASG 303]|uniref:redox-sensitive transcriptional activator SoxR n=1 Tax=Streptacidiphilus sp. ASG 303 TaxID=2896847 RepID=UPI001E2D3138|nr:redox-sensitive transcriptional activator SoxR [Streptacidiphilus sp. ASG 303]MCD0485446.1 redox-sensitive transcriptional activator SoxR [Streptacidiphilus sp. ASG 303]